MAASCSRKSQETEPQTTSCCDMTIRDMLRKLILTASYFGSEQISGTALSLDDKFNYAHKLYHKSLPSFIFQYGYQIEDQHVAHLTELYKDIENIEYHLRTLQREIKRRSIRIRNRRFTAMTKLMSETDYFSEEEMKQRNPLLYQQMIGVYLSEDEIGEQSRNIAQHHSNLSDFLFFQMDTDGINEVYERQKDHEKEIEEDSDNLENENSESEESEMEDDDGQSPAVKQIKINNEEKQLLRAEFLHTMQERFMSGKDVGFDYSTVDDNESYDDLNTEEHDDQEKYFDSSDSEDNTTDEPTPNPNSSYGHLAEGEYDF